MLYILEGCDGTGKSTLATQLSKLLDAEVIHCTKDTPNTELFFLNIVRAAEKRNIIADRFCYGQYVYQQPEERPLEYGGLETSYRGLNHLEAMMLESGVKVILVDADTDVIVDRLQARNEKILNGMEVNEVRCKFYDIMNNKSILPWLVYRTDTEVE